MIDTFFEEAIPSVAQNSKSDLFNAGMYEGEEINLYFNPNNPTAICTKSGGYLAAISLILVGGLINAILLGIYIKRR